MLWPPEAYPYSGTAFGALLAAVTLPELVNLLPSPRDRARNQEFAKSAALKWHGDALDRLFFRAAKEGEAVEITLANRKVYIGYVVDAPNLEREGRYLGLLPVTSGYRESETLEFNETTDYDFLAGPKADPENFTIVIPVADIKIANLFDYSVHARSGPQ